MPFDVNLDDEDFREAIDLPRRQVSEERIKKFEGCMAEFFAVSGVHK